MKNTPKYWELATQKLKEVYGIMLKDKCHSMVSSSIIEDPKVSLSVFAQVKDKKTIIFSYTVTGVNTRDVKETIEKTEVEIKWLKNL